MRRQVIRHALVALLALAAVVVTLHARPADQPRPGPLWEPTAAAEPAPDCALPDASWDSQEPPVSVAVAGDSVLGQAATAITTLAEQRCHLVTIAARSGGAPCDLLPSYGAVMSAAPHPLRRVMLSWVGNVGASPCMVAAMGQNFGTARWGDDANGPATLTAAEVTRAGQLYEASLRQMVAWDLAMNIQTVFVLPPPMRPGTYHRQMEAQLIERYTNIGDAFGGVWTTSSPRALLGGDTWQASVAGLQVRHTDNVHLHAPGGTRLWALGIVSAATL